METLINIHYKNVYKTNINQTFFVKPQHFWNWLVFLTKWVWTSKYIIYDPPKNLDKIIRFGQNVEIMLSFYAYYVEDTLLLWLSLLSYIEVQQHRVAYSHLQRGYLIYYWIKSLCSCWSSVPKVILTIGCRHISNCGNRTMSQNHMHVHVVLEYDTNRNLYSTGLYSLF